MTKKAQVVQQEDIFPSLEIFKSFISQWFPYLRPLPIDLKDNFIDSAIGRYIELEPLDGQWQLHFRINRLEVVAVKQ